MQFTILCGGHFATGADNLSDPSSHLSPSPIAVSVVQQMKMLIKETLSPVLCVYFSVRVTRQRGALNPFPATARQLNGSVSTLGPKRAMYDLF